MVQIFTSENNGPPYSVRHPKKDITCGHEHATVSLAMECKDRNKRRWNWNIVDANGEGLP